MEKTNNRQMGLVEESKLKIKVQRRIVVISVLLLIGKFIAYLLTNSVGILTDAMESIVNVTAGFLGLYSLKISAKPKDSNHPFGHGKVESISASLEGIMIILAGIVIILEGVKRLFMPMPVDKLDIGILIIALSGLINYIAGSYSIRVGRKYDSMALVAGGKHLHSDTYSTIGLVVGLILLYITGLYWIDSVLALIFGTIIVVTGVNILRKTISNLMDKADVKTLEKMAEAIVEKRNPDWIDIHNLKTIRYGNILFIDCDLTIPWYYNTVQGHNCNESLSEVIGNVFSGRVLISVHTDPCSSYNCSSCAILSCPVRQLRYVERLELSLEYMTMEEPEEEDEKQGGTGNHDDVFNHTAVHT